jgi:hypothetical protein
MSQICVVSVKFLKDVRDFDKICNPFDYRRITFPFEPLTKIGFL